MSLKFQELPDDTCRLLATWTIPYLDTRGIFYADPMIVKGTILPMRSDITPEQVRSCLDAMAKVGLIKIFKHGGHFWQYWPGFLHNQVGLRPDREGECHYPEYLQDEELPTPELVRSESGATPPEEKRSRKEVQVEEKGNAAAPRAPKQPAPFMDHPDVAAYRDITHLTPNETARRAISEHNPPIDKWRETITFWLARGWDPKNIPGMLERCANPPPPHANGNGNGAHGSASDQAIQNLINKYERQEQS